MRAGYKHNVIPGEASALLDCRFLPGRKDQLLDTIRELAGPGVEIVVDEIADAIRAPHTGPLMEAMSAALRAEDPGAAVLPYTLSAGTDNKHLAELGIAGYGFAPLRLPDDLDFTGMFHGVDERVPVDSLRFGTRVLHRFLDTC
ncbi:MAG: M20/M25/M40 family metallo-hydrolase [Kineosporiaceae bacterium]